METGKFIVFEGIDGAGTTTQTEILRKYLQELGKETIQTYEPTRSSEFGLELRRRLEHKLLPEEKIIHDSEYWTQLFIKDRLWHLNNHIIPNLEQGKQVICDRHMLSTLAYQSTQGRDMKELIAMHQTMRKPDLTFFIDLDIESAFARMGKRNEATEYFEKKEFLKRVVENYHHAIKLVGEIQNVTIIDGQQSIEQISQYVQKQIHRLYDFKN